MMAWAHECRQSQASLCDKIRLATSEGSKFKSHMHAYCSTMTVDVKAELKEPYVLSEQQIESYEQLGFIRLKQVFSPQLLEYYRQFVEEAVRDAGDGALRPNFHVCCFLWASPSSVWDNLYNFPNRRCTRLRSAPTTYHRSCNTEKIA
jgi:hypothetical protein